MPNTNPPDNHSGSPAKLQGSRSLSTEPWPTELAPTTEASFQAAQTDRSQRPSTLYWTSIGPGGPTNWTAPMKICDCPNHPAVYWPRCEAIIHIPSCSNRSPYGDYTVKDGKRGAPSIRRHIRDVHLIHQAASFPNLSIRDGRDVRRKSNNQMRQSPQIRMIQHQKIIDERESGVE